MRARTNKRAFFATALALSLVLLLALAASAYATPTLPPMLTLGELQQKLNTAGGPIEGYFATVDSGSTIETIPCTVKAIAEGYILFEGHGTQITNFGGIVAGMSGSPVYIHDTDDDTDKIIGAVSYGDFFTKGGTGLATPIEYMTNLESSYSPAFAPLSKPVMTSSGLINRIIVVPDPQDYSGAAKQGAFVGRSLSEYFVGGLKPTSKAYKRIESRLSARGISVVPLAKRLGVTPIGADPDFETTLTSGAAVAALETRGDMWVGDLGTVTYAADNDVVAFGHPMNDSGDTTFYMLNGWIDGVWPSIFEPYKMGEPTKLRGTITQDRDAGVLGQLDEFPDETVITAHASDDKGHSADSLVYTPRNLINQGFVDSSIVAGGVSIAGSQLFDSGNMAGSADITTTVVVNDGTRDYTVVIPDMVDDSSDVTFASSFDAADAIDALQSVLADGVHTIDVVSVELKSKITSHRRFGTVVNVKFDSALHAGANHAVIEALVFGKAATQTVDATLTIPAGMPLTGTINVGGVNNVMSVYMSDSGPNPGTLFPVPTRKTVAQIVDDLNNTAPLNAVTLTFQAVNMSDESDVPVVIPSITTTVTTPWVASGAVRQTTAQIVLDPQSSVFYGDSIDISGEIDGPTNPGTVTVYATPAGGSETLVGTTQATMQGGALLFDLPIDNMTTNTTFRVHFDAQPGFTPADAVEGVGVQAMVSLSPSARATRRGRTVTLRATVVPPVTAGGSVVFEYNDKGRHWKAIGTRTLANGGWRSTASIGWKVVRGKHAVRVRYLGGAYNAASSSFPLSITGR